jgi:hypothetical protein
MGFIVVTEEPSSREVGDVIIMGDSRPDLDLGVLGSDWQRFDVSDVSQIWSRESADVEEDEGEAEEDDEEDDDEEEDDEADAEAQDDDTDSERA